MASPEEEERVIQALLDSLPKPRPATAQRLDELLDPCVTVKLDGVRTLLVRCARGLLARALRSQDVIDTTPGEFSAYDTERIGPHFYVFDVLFVNGVDVRHLPLRARLREANCTLPGCASLKRFYWGPEPSLSSTVQRLVCSRPKLADGSRVEALEGFIFGSLSAPYDWAPLKFKFGVTCDFLVSSPKACAPDTARTLLLNVQRAQMLEEFRGYGDAPRTITVSAAEAAALELPNDAIEVRDCIVLELKLVVGSWLVVRRRKDRQRPNTARTVIENLQLQCAGKCDARFLLRHLEGACHSQSSVDQVRDAMLRAAGTSAAVAASGPASALFLPDALRLSAELEPTEGTPPRVVAVVAPPLSVLVGPRTSVSKTFLPLEGGVGVAKQKGWRCRRLAGLRARDFLAGYAKLPASLRLALEDVCFLLLQQEP